jgi:hypothetical protein
MIGSFDEIYEELMMLIDYMNIKFKNDIDFKYNYEEHLELRKLKIDDKQK